MEKDSASRKGTFCLGGVPRINFPLVKIHAVQEGEKPRIGFDGKRKKSSMGESEEECRSFKMKSIVQIVLKIDRKKAGGELRGCCFSWSTTLDLSICQSRKRWSEPI